MIEITNKKLFPVQILLKSSKSTKSMTVMNIPGIGSGKNKVKISEENDNEYINRLERMKYISKEYIK